MGSPCAYLLLRAPLSAAQQGRVCADLGLVGDRTDFRLRGLPFVALFGEQYPFELDELRDTGLVELLGWAPRATLGFAALVGNDQAHRGVAELCLSFARRLDGVIDFGGAIAARPSFRRYTWSPATRIEQPDGLAGVLFECWYQTANGDYAICHYADPEFLAAWMNDERFRMVT